RRRHAAARRAPRRPRRQSRPDPPPNRGHPMQATLLTNFLLPLALGVIMLGLGMGLTLEDFRRVARYPRAVLVGLGLQTLACPGWPSRWPSAWACGRSWRWA